MPFVFLIASLNSLHQKTLNCMDRLLTIVGHFTVVLGPSSSVCIELVKRGSYNMVHRAGQINIALTSALTL